MKCSRCQKDIEGYEIKFAREGDFMGKPLCRKCRINVEEEYRENYREGLTKDQPRNTYEVDAYLSST
jgi:hypothetical protein